MLRLMTIARHHPEAPFLDPDLFTAGDLWCEQMLRGQRCAECALGGDLLIIIPYP